MLLALYCLPVKLKAQLYEPGPGHGGVRARHCYDAGLMIRDRCFDSEMDKNELTSERVRKIKEINRNTQLQ